MIRGPAMSKLLAVRARWLLSGMALAAAMAAAGCALKSAESSALAGSSPETWARALAARRVDPAAVVNPIAFTPEMRREAERLARPGGVRNRL